MCVCASICVCVRHVLPRGCDRRLIGTFVLHSHESVVAAKWMGGHASAPRTATVAAAWTFATSAFALAYANRDKKDTSTAMAPGAVYQRSSVYSMPTRLPPSFAETFKPVPAPSDSCITVQMEDMDDKAREDAHMVSMTDALIPLLRPASHRSSRPISGSSHLVDDVDEEQLITADEGDETTDSSQVQGKALAPPSVAEQLASMESRDIETHAEGAAMVSGQDLAEAVRLVQRANMRYDPNIVAVMRKVSSCECSVCSACVCVSHVGVS
jgi:hypothetical protein